jgi:hypothetical protein
MSRDFIPKRMMAEILEIARHRGDFVLFETGEMYDCRGPEPEPVGPPGDSSGIAGLHYYHVGVSTRPVKRELRRTFAWSVHRPREDPPALLDPAGDLFAGGDHETGPGL